MKFKQHFSGSSGNLYEVTTSNGDRLIIEAGVRWKKVMSALNYNLKGVLGVFISHGHL